jgi:hypothetical protein
MNEYEGDIVDMEETVEEIHRDLDRLDEVVTEMAKSVTCIAEAIEDCLCCEDYLCCEDEEDEEWIEFIPCQCGEESNNGEEPE